MIVNNKYTGRYYVARVYGKANRLRKIKGKCYMLHARNRIHFNMEIQCGARQRME